MKKILIGTIRNAENVLIDGRNRRTITKAEL
jgi:hypothetical protein